MAGSWRPRWCAFLGARRGRSAVYRSVVHLHRAVEASRVLQPTGWSFGGVEVKTGETLTCDPGDDKYLYLSHAAIGETKYSKANERVSLYVHVDGKKLVPGTLSRGNCDQISLDLVFDKEFKRSHNLQSENVLLNALMEGKSHKRGKIQEQQQH